MTDLIRAARHAKEVLDYVDRFLIMNKTIREELVKDAIADLEKAIEQTEKQEQEHENRITALEIRVAKLEKPMTDHEKQLMAGQRSLLRTAPPQRKWVGLTDEEFKYIASKYLLNRETGLEYFKDEIEAKLKEKNNAN